MKFIMLRTQNAQGRGQWAGRVVASYTGKPVTVTGSVMLVV